MTETVSLVDKIVPDFFITATNNFSGNLSQFESKNIVLFFYPKDNTPICTSEAKAFRDHFDALKKFNVVVFGVSRDSLTSHERFKSRLELPFELIADTSEELCQYFDFISMKNFFGKKIRGIVRSTVLIDKNRILRRVWRKVKVTGHVDEVRKALEQLNT